ncbi:hypothetical protein HDU67_000349 [Dinochytrium kinnereticum]|nr:hypothetical protein HDU67_000349 [Dinochytrium kinnereticum]
MSFLEKMTLQMIIRIQMGIVHKPTTPVAFAFAALFLCLQWFIKAQAMPIPDISWDVNDRDICQDRILHQYTHDAGPFHCVTPKRRRRPRYPYHHKPRRFGRYKPRYPDEMEEAQGSLDPGDSAMSAEEFPDEASIAHRGE